MCSSLTPPRGQRSPLRLRVTAKPRTWMRSEEPLLRATVENRTNAGVSSLGALTTGHWNHPLAHPLVVEVEYRKKVEVADQRRAGLQHAVCFGRRLSFEWSPRRRPRPLRTGEVPHLHHDGVAGHGSLRRRLFDHYSLLMMVAPNRRKGRPGGAAF